MGSRGRPYRTFSFESFDILVGRGEDDNDTLTFDVARGEDLWLHVGGGTPGSHVVVRNPGGGAIPTSVVIRAAGLAAWYSKARHSPQVEVHHCPVSHVRKPRGAPAGLVELTSWKRVRVPPFDPGAET